MSGWELIIEIASWVLILSGSFFAFVGALGVWRLPEFWSRLHGASVTDSAGMILLLAGMALQGGLTLVTVKIIIIGIFLFITGPTATHAVANAAFVTGLRPTEAPGLVSDADDPDTADAAGGTPAGQADRDGAET